MSITMTLPITALRPHEHNPRGPVPPESVQELAESIRQHGILQPLVVCLNGAPGVYTVVAGHRRLAAAIVAGLHDVPCCVHEHLSETEISVLIVVENLQRQDLSPVEEARAFQQLRNLGLTQAEMARQIGCSPARIGERLAILRLDQRVQDAMHRGEISHLLARSLVKVVDPATQWRLAVLAAKKSMTVAQLEDLIKRNQGQLGEERPRPVAATVRPVEPGPRRTTRDGALALLQAEPERTVTCRQVAELMDDTCGLCADCGMANLEAVCSDCPLPELASRLAR